MLTIKQLNNTIFMKNMFEEPGILSPLDTECHVHYESLSRYEFSYEGLLFKQEGRKMAEIYFLYRIMI